MSRNIYLDYHATTPCDPEVVSGMLPYFTDKYSNSSSTDHKAGRSVAQDVEKARVQVAKLINADKSEIVFTSGATESNNLAIAGLTRANRSKRKHIITSSIEHKAVLAPCHLAESYGYEVTVINTDSEGVVSREALGDALRTDTLLVSIQAANNEIGTIQEIRELSGVSRSGGALFHCDAAQAASRVTIDVDEWGVDLLSLSGHKMYGPKGIGALYLRGGARGLPITPLSVGGGHEGELRPGTHNVPAIIGFGIAAKLCLERTKEEAKRMRELRDQLENELFKLIPVMQVNGCIDNRLPNNTSITLPGIDAGALINNLPELSISTGSACMSGAIEPSYVLQAIGLNREDADSTIRIGLGRFSTVEEIRKACKLIVEAYRIMQELELQLS